MKITTLVGLVVITGAVGGAAFYLSNQGRATIKSEIATERFLPDLVNKVNDVAELEVKKADKGVTFKRAADGWEISDKGGYPAKIEKVKEILVGLAELRKVEPKTSKPENYAKIGVEDPGTAKPEKPATPDQPATPSSATLLTLKDDKGQTISSVIVGNSKWEGKPGVYIRKAGDAQSWLADGQLNIPADFTGWVEPQALSITRDRIKFAQITQPSGEKAVVSREKKDDVNFTVHDVPAGSELMGSNAGEAIGASLGYITFEDVRPIDQINFDGTKTGAIGVPGPSSEFLTFDGMKVLVQTAIEEVPAKEPKTPQDKPEKQEKLWAHFIAVYDDASAPKPPEAKPEDPPKPADPTKPTEKKPEEVQKEVVELNSKVAKWAFQLPAYKASGFKTTVKSMLKDKPPAPPPSLNEGNQFAPANPPTPDPASVPPATQPPPAAQPPATPPPAAPPAPQPEPKVDPKQDPQSPVKPPADPPKPNPGGG